MTSPGPRTFVSLTFDDGLASHHRLLPILARHGARATFYVCTGLIGRDERYLDWEQLGELAADGHEIGGHTRDHVKLTELPPSEVRRQIASDRETLLERGFAARSFAYPFGAADDGARASAAAAGYACARRSWGLANESARDRPVTETVPPDDVFLARTVPSIDAAPEPEALEQLVVDGERAGGWLPLVFHEVDAERLERFLAWLAPRESRGTAVRRVDDVIAAGETRAA